MELRPQPLPIEFPQQILAGPARPWVREISLMTGTSAERSLGLATSYSEGRWFSSTRVVGTVNPNRYPYRNLAVEGSPRSLMSGADWDQKGILQHLRYQYQPRSYAEVELWAQGHRRGIPSSLTSTPIRPGRTIVCYGSKLHGTMPWGQGIMHRSPRLTKKTLTDTWIPSRASAGCIALNCCNPGPVWNTSIEVGTCRPGYNGIVNGRSHRNMLGKYHRTDGPWSCPWPCIEVVRNSGLKSTRRSCKGNSCPWRCNCVGIEAERVVCPGWNTDVP